MAIGRALDRSEAAASGVPQSSDCRIWALCGLLAVPYGLSLLLIRATQVGVATPWAFLLWIAYAGLPYAYCLLRGLLLTQATLAHRRLPIRILGLACGLASVWLLPPLGSNPGVWLLLCAVVLLVDSMRNVRPNYFAFSVVANLLALSLTLGIVCNLNYLLAPTSSQVLHDPALMRADMAIYDWLFSHPVAYRGLFPLTRSPVALRFLENAYQMLFLEMLIVILALSWLGRGASTFMRAISLCYLAGLVVFFFYPAVGPSIYYPETFRANLHTTGTYALMHSMSLEFEAALAQRAHNGFAYFIAMPSLHAAIAVVCQRFLAPTRLLFWAFVPINALIVASTVMLGYHYVVDVPAGILIAIGAVRIVRGKAGVPAALGPSCLSLVTLCRRASRMPGTAPAAHHTTHVRGS